MTDQDHQLISQYLEGALAPDARAAFEQRLQAEPELAEAFALHQGLDVLLQNEYEKEVQQAVDTILTDVAPPEVEDVHVRRMPVWGWAAAAVVVVLLGFWWWSTQTTSPYEKVLADNFQPLVYAGNSKGPTPEMKLCIWKAMRLTQVRISASAGRL